MLGITVVQTWDILYFKPVDKLLHPVHFCWIIGHLVIVTVTFFLNLFCYQLRVSPDKESSNAEIFG
jgi:dolichyl-phosphate-mannose--protein O-mannosyl transferase